MAAEQPYFVAIPHQKGLLFLTLREIVAIEAGRSYCTFHMEGGQKHTVSRSLSWAEEHLLPLGYCRPHRSWLVNPKHVRALFKHQGHQLHMSNGLQIPISEQARERVMEWLKGIALGG